ncbi:calcitonin gene-related peptide type 1 receptor isoform X2 [Cryptotermes secundus]|uniref:calcitonin gene-related peptide type 1 receptor isoform X2 n=1 Tax=Cryptotermes secundus TaxID=105785 RepID=UPI000CD7B7F8|nr:calcitonin gene-related peptide type 1 receptor isoform X2 [Cryptotermes secundus]
MIAPPSTTETLPEILQNISDTVSPLDKMLLERKEECWLMLNKTFVATSVSTTAPGLFCPGTFDGWSCWPETPAGSSAHAPCPEFITGFDPNRMAHKECLENGTWFRHPSSGQVWSNYTTCVNIDDLNWRQQVNRIYETGYSVSLVALLMSLGILFYFKSLRCARTTLHMNLFASFAINNALWLLWYRIVVNQPEVIVENGEGCKVLHVILHYFLLTNYAWMLCEGFYLHTLLVAAFISESRLVKWLYGLGWAMPLAPTIIYTSLRASNHDANDTKECWINESPYTIVLIVPVCASMVLNLIFLCNILRVLLLKLRAGPRVGSSRPSSTLLQALRATLLLVPLLGLHYLVTPFRPSENHPWEGIYEVTSAITASFQGLCVATLFCFCNGEVVAQIKRRWQHLMFRPRANSCTATTVSIVRSNGGNGILMDEDNV